MPLGIFWSTWLGTCLAVEAPSRHDSLCNPFWAENITFTTVCSQIFSKAKAVGSTPLSTSLPQTVCCPLQQCSSHRIKGSHNILNWKVLWPIRATESNPWLCTGAPKNQNPNHTFERKASKISRGQSIYLIQKDYVSCSQNAFCFQTPAGGTSTVTQQAGRPQEAVEAEGISEFREELEKHMGSILNAYLFI